MTKRLVIIATLLIAPCLAHAQKLPTQPPQPAPPAEARQPDPRLSGPTIDVLKALLALREGEMKALSDDTAAKLTQREKDWTEYSRPLWDEKKP